jgi:hypothetical protein
MQPRVEEPPSGRQEEPSSDHSAPGFQSILAPADHPASSARSRGALGRWASTEDVPNAGRRDRTRPSALRGRKRGSLQALWPYDSTAALELLIRSPHLPRQFSTATGPFYLPQLVAESRSCQASSSGRRDRGTGLLDFKWVFPQMQRRRASRLQSRCFNFCLAPITLSSKAEHRAT